MISLYSGTPGSGKSMHMAKDIRDRMIMGKPTICNFQINTTKFKRANFLYLPNHELTPDFLINYSREYFKTHRFKEGTIHLYIDECQLIFNAREWQQNGRNLWLSFFTQHRHYGYDIILVAQFDRMIDRYIRSLIEYEFIHRKASRYGIGGMIFSFFSGGNLFIAVQMWYPLKARIGAEFFHARKKYYRLYDSYVHFSADASGAGGDSGAPPAPEAAADEVAPDPHEHKKLILLRSFFSKKPKEKAPRRSDRCEKHKKGRYESSDKKRTLRSSGGKFLRPGGRTETGWRQAQPT